MPTTPVVKWDPDPRVAWYMVYVSEDASFTNLLEPGNTIPATNNSMYAPALDNDDHTYGDNQAGKAYFWYVRPCRAALDCGPDPVSTIDKAQGTFIKRSPAGHRAGEQPAGAGGEISFSWDHYWDSNQAYTWPQTGEKGPQAAKQYRIEVSVNGSVVESTLVDQTAFTSPSRLYPEGTLTLACPGRRLRRQRAHLVRGRDGHQGHAAHRADVPDRLRGCPRHHAAAVAGAGVRVVVRRAGRA